MKMEDIITVKFERDYLILMLFPFAFEILITGDSLSFSVQIMLLNISLNFTIDNNYFNM
tara:strand:+ start:1642 stop:1818 length:177 start_codon:yes stop_codon:yes gene_type:complete